MTQYTPMMQQYLKIKADYTDAFLFFRLGDFYEMFFDDAIRASQELEITLTSREGGNDRIPMCGVPYHSAANYIDTLIERGYKVAICEQTEDPKQVKGKGVVRREVVQLITPGTKMESKGLNEKENNYLAAISLENKEYLMAYTDLSTGENKVTAFSTLEQMINELASIGVKEVVINATISEDSQKRIRERMSVVFSVEEESEEKEAYVALLTQIQPVTHRMNASRLFNYLYRTQKRSLDHLQPAVYIQQDEFMKIDYYSKRNLEITETIRSKGKKGSLLWLLDETMTAMGGRMLKTWLDRPLLSKEKIEERQQIVTAFLENFFERHDLRERLKEVYDLERLAGRIAFGNVNARDLIQLKHSLQQVPAIISMLENVRGTEKFASALDPCDEVAQLLETSLIEQPPLSIKEGNIIKDGYSSQLDTFRDASRNGKKWLAELEAKERQRTGIKSLKIGYNRVFGYFIEITKANLALLKDGEYERKQTLSNAERFITPELKEKESLILQAEEESVELEYQLFMKIRETVKSYIPRLQQLAKTISELDVLQCFATISEQRHYVKPSFSDNRDLVIEEGRHPVVEKVMNAQVYVANGCEMTNEKEMLLITGPNMSGKSTYMRQVALTSILAQVGCYVPASSAVLPIFDQIFTRIGAADDLISGQSTFMVEMLEARNAIVHATENSLILFDEIGRGTSTYDGMALAQAIIEYIHDNIGCKTLFSTHYHELTVLAEQLSLLNNVHVRAVEQNGNVVFLHQIKEGPADKSYGIHVAKLAELPEALISRADELLMQLEQTKHELPIQSAAREVAVTSTAQLSLFEEETASTKEIVKEKRNTEHEDVLVDLKNVNLLELNPLQALNKLYELQKKLND